MSESLLPPKDALPGAGSQRSRQRALPKAPTQPAADKPADARLRKACSEFESVFIAYLLKEMRATVDKSGLIDGGQSEELYQGIMDAEIARDLSAAGGLGLARMLYDQLAARSHRADAGRGEQAEGRDAAALPPEGKIR